MRVSDMEKLHTSCPECHARYSVTETLIGKRARCKKCGKTFVVAPSETSAKHPPDAEGHLTGSPARSQRPATTTRPESEGGAAEDDVPVIWHPGDVILDVYEVKKFSEEMEFAQGGMGMVHRVHHRN